MTTDPINDSPRTDFSGEQGNKFTDDLRAGQISFSPADTAKLPEGYAKFGGRGYKADTLLTRDDLTAITRGRNNGKPLDVQVVANRILSEGTKTISIREYLFMLQELIRTRRASSTSFQR